MIMDEIWWTFMNNLCKMDRKHILLTFQTLRTVEAGRKVSWREPRRSVGPYIGYPHAQQERTTGGAAEVCCAFVNSLAGSLAFSLPPPFLPRFGLWPPFDVLEENFVFERASQTSVEVGLLAWHFQYSNFSGSLRKQNGLMRRVQ